MREGHDGARGALIQPADAAQVLGNLTVVVEDGPVECVAAIAAIISAWQIVSERW